MNSDNLASTSVLVQVDLTELFTVRPTLVTDKFMVSNNRVQTGNGLIELVSSNGLLLQTRSIKAGSILAEEFDMHSLPSGVYFVRIKLGSGEVKTIKLSKVQ